MPSGFTVNTDITKCTADVSICCEKHGEKCLSRRKEKHIVTIITFNRFQRTLLIPLLLKLNRTISTIITAAIVISFISLRETIFLLYSNISRAYNTLIASLCTAARPQKKTKEKKKKGSIGEVPVQEYFVLLDNDNTC